MTPRRRKPSSPTLQCVEGSDERGLDCGLPRPAAPPGGAALGEQERGDRRERRRQRGEEFEMRGYLAALTHALELSVGFPRRRRVAESGKANVLRPRARLQAELRPPDITGVHKLGREHGHRLEDAELPVEPA